MKNINKVLIQLDKAVELANSALPQERALAVILFDNIIEIQLYKKLSHLFMMDRVSWYNEKRAFDQKKREKAMKQYVGLLQVAKDAHIITEQHLQILKYAHEIRNKAYHADEYEDDDINIALELYHFIIEDNKEILSKAGLIGHTNQAGYDMIDFGQGIDDSDPFWLFQSEKYFEDAKNHILPKLKITSDFKGLAQQYLRDQLETIEYRINFLEKERKNFNFYAALGMYWFMNTIFHDHERKGTYPRDLDSILLCARYIRLYEDVLSDIDSPSLRQKRGNLIYRKFRKKHKGKYPHWPNLNSIKRRINNLSPEVHKAVGSLIQIQIDWHEFKTDLSEASFYMDGFIMEEFDRYRGK